MLNRGRPPGRGGVWYTNEEDEAILLCVPTGISPSDRSVFARGNPRPATTLVGDGMTCYISGLSLKLLLVHS